MDKVNNEPPENSKNKILFENLTPLHPTEVLKLEREIRAEENITSRVIDMIALLGQGETRAATSGAGTPVYTQGSA